jgi:hypothetical protein
MPKKSRSKKANVNAEAIDEENSDDVKEKPKRKRASKKKNDTNELIDPANALIQELVSQANASDEKVLAMENSEKETTVPVKKAKIVRKPRAPKVKPNTNVDVEVEDSDKE